MAQALTLKTSRGVTALLVSAAPSRVTGSLQPQSAPEKVTTFHFHVDNSYDAISKTYILLVACDFLIFIRVWKQDFTSMC